MTDPKQPANDPQQKHPKGPAKDWPGQKDSNAPTDREKQRDNPSNPSEK